MACLLIDNISIVSPRVFHAQELHTRRVFAAGAIRCTVHIIFFVCSNHYCVLGWLVCAISRVYMPHENDGPI